MKSCQTCRYCAKVKFDQEVDCCVALPPVASVARDTAGNMTITAVYPPVSGVPCGMWKRKWWWTR